MMEAATYEVEPARSSSSLPRIADDDAISFLPPLPSPESSLIPTTEKLKFQALGAASASGYLLPPALPNGPSNLMALAASGNPTDHALQLSKAKEHEKRRKWCAAYDAAQPSGRSLNANDEEFQHILRAFRATQPKKVKPAVIFEETEVKPKEKEKKGFKKFFASRKLF